MAHSFAVIRAAKPSGSSHGENQREELYLDLIRIPKTVDLDSTGERDARRKEGIRNLDPILVAGASTLGAALVPPLYRLA